MGAHRAGGVRSKRAWRDPETDRADKRRYALAVSREKAEWFRGIKRSLSCAHCGMSFANCPECLDFHHIDPMTKETRGQPLAVRGKQFILNEIAKCIPLCANCHRRHHAREAPPLPPIPGPSPLTPTGARAVRSQLDPTSHP